MKKIFYISLLFFNANVYSQIITTSIDANFGVDADLQANYYDTMSSSAGDGDWFSLLSGAGIGVIDTTGASGIVANYSSNPSFRYSSFYRGMSVPSFSVINNKLLLGAAFIRDYHGNDSTSFSGSKNGDSPGIWYSPPSQPVPNKNDILDAMMHVRRDGPSVTDSLWLFGGVSIDGTTGDRYFDFEMYQTDLTFDKTTGTFSGYGPDGGHTSWTFDGSGNVVTPGDIIFSADYSSSTLSSIEARIWINKASMSITPVAFSWSGSFDGASNGAQYGYAGIKPKTSGNFYTGLENAGSTWAGSFSLIIGNNSVVSNYSAGQFMEFSVNLSKLGLDPNTMVGKSSCDMPFRTFMVKSRSSMSFTSQLKDFIAPIDFFKSAAAIATSDGSVYCGFTGPENLYVSNPLPGSVYTWTTTDGDIVSNAVNDSITVDSPGTYVVSQKLQSFCPTYSTDTVVVNPFDPSCSVLKTSITDFSGWVKGIDAQLNWTVMNNSQIRFFEIESSTDGINYSFLQKIYAKNSDFPSVDYHYTDYNLNKESSSFFYRLRIINIAGIVSYSKVLRLTTNDSFGKVNVFPNPVSYILQVSINAPQQETVEVSIYNAAGTLMRKFNKKVQKGNSKITISDIQGWPTGIYSVKVIAGKLLFINKMILKE